jgi:hypothetical protein
VSTVVGSGQAGALPLALLRTDPYDLSVRCRQVVQTIADIIFIFIFLFRFRFEYG